MFLGFISLLILVIVIVSHIRLTHKIRDHELLLMNEKTEIMLLVKRTDAIASKVLDIAQRIIDHQNALDDKMDALSKLVDKHSTSVTFREEQFNALIRADVLAARREELLRAKELKIALERLMGVAMTSRQPPAPNDIIALENLTNRIEELGGVIDGMMN